MDKNISDKTLLQQVQRKMMQKGASSGKITATVRGGDATITGSIRYEHERKAILRSVSAVDGIRRVIDQIRLEEHKRPTN